MSMAGMKVRPHIGRNQPYQAWGTFDGEGVYKLKVQRLAIRKTLVGRHVPGQDFHLWGDF